MRLGGERVGVVERLVEYPTMSALLVRKDDGSHVEVPFVATYVVERVDVDRRASILPGHARGSIVIVVVTLFPELFDPFAKTSFVGRAATGGQLTLELRSPRDFGIGKHKSVDDTPYGGGSGMVMRVDVLVACMEAFAPGARRVLLTPQGRPFDQAKAIELSQRARPSCSSAGAMRDSTSACARSPTRRSRSATSS